MLKTHGSGRGAHGNSVSIINPLPPWEATRGRLGGCSWEIGRLLVVGWEAVRGRLVFNIWQQSQGFVHPDTISDECLRDSASRKQYLTTVQ